MKVILNFMLCKMFNDLINHLIIYFCLNKSLSMIRDQVDGWGLGRPTLSFNRRKEKKKQKAKSKKKVK